MSYVRIWVAAVMLIAACISASLLFALDDTPVQKKDRAYCQGVFDKTVDDCLKNPGRYANAGGGANCTQVAAEMWTQCMRQHGFDVRGQRPPGSTGLSKDRPTGTPPKIAPVTATPSKRKVIDSRSVGRVNPAKSVTPTPTPFGTPKPVPKTVASPSPKKG